MLKKSQTKGVYDQRIVQEVCGIFSYLTTDTYLREKPLSATRSKERIAEIYHLKFSEVDGILCGRQISSGVDKEVRDRLVEDYNSGVSVRELAKNYKISTAGLYKALHETENKGGRIEWRGGLNLESKIAETNKPTFWETARKAAAGFLAGVLFLGNSAGASYRPDQSQTDLQSPAQTSTSDLPDTPIEHIPYNIMGTEPYNTISRQQYTILQETPDGTRLILEEKVAKASEKEKKAINKEMTPEQKRMWETDVHRNGIKTRERVLIPLEPNDVYQIAGDKITLHHF